MQYPRGYQMGVQGIINDCRDVLSMNVGIHFQMVVGGFFQMIVGGIIK